jgi:hypothetical protein
MAIGPVNYMEAMPQINLGQQLGQGLQIGAQFAQIEQQRAAQEMAMREAQEKQRRAEAFRTNFSAYLQAPTARGWAALVAENPGMREALGDINKTLSADQAKVEQREALELFTALERDPAVAVQLVESRIEAARNTGQPTEELEAIRAQVQSNPALVRALALGRAASLPDGDKAISAIIAAEAAPAQRRKTAAEATTAEVTAANAPELARIDVATKGAAAKVQQFKAQEEDSRTSRSSRRRRRCVSCVCCGFKRKRSGRACSI